MKISRWTPDFHPDVESPIVPVWISFDSLPLHLHDKSPLFSIAGMIGKLLKVDATTLNHTRPSTGKVCVELDLLHEIPSKVLILNGSKEIIQPVFYDDLPSYCTCDTAPKHVYF
ncbi:unnamed protein product [Cuscuta europaea]|uniref:DUF4283 domain-containing protein n=1 Tax=Cuscuta europaea TaxID=41803 RepID=A0A9P1EA46_CUSEU|nr:unnamed protein product [Cuscuta europaea]